MISNNIKSFCKDDITKIENYDKAIADKTQTWVCHHRLELTLNGEKALSRKEMKRFGMYYHRPHFELIFLTKNEHSSLHSKCYSSEDMKNIRYGITKRITKSNKRSYTHDFADLYYAKYGLTYSDNPKKYNTNLVYYRRHKKLKCE